MQANNSDIARVFEEIATLLELADESPFKVRAYRNAAEEIEALSFDIAGRLAKGEALPKIYGVGEELAAKIREIVETRRCRYLDGLRARFPSGVTELLSLAGLGPKRVRVLYQKLGVGSAADLQRGARGTRARAGRLRPEKRAEDPRRSAEIPARATRSGALAPLLIGPDELCLGYEGLHRRLELGLGRLSEIGQRAVERVELVEVAVAADGRAGSAVARALPVVQALRRACR